MIAFWQEITDKLQEEALNALLPLLAIPSVCAEGEEGMPFGREINNALLYTLGLGESLGFACTDLDGYAGIIDLPAESAEETVGILCHLDVVPPDGVWQTPPFAPSIREGRLYARGAVDDKGPLIAALYAMKAVEQSGLPRSRRVRLICGTDEETGFRCMHYYKKNAEIPAMGFSPDGDFPVVYAEKGIAHFELVIPLGDEQELLAAYGGEAGNIIPASAYAVIEPAVCGSSLAVIPNISIASQPDGLHIKASGTAAHASLPQKGDNAIASLLAALSQCEFAEAAKGAFRKLYRLFGRDYEGSGAGIGYKDEESGSMSLSPTMLSFEKGNLKLTFDMRYAVTDSFERIEPLLQGICDENGWSYHLLSQKVPLNVGRDSALVKSLNKVYNSVMGENAKPIAIGGGTYSRAFNNFVAFGPVFPTDEEVAHMTDEYLRLDSFKLWLSVYAQAIYELVK